MVDQTTRDASALQNRARWLGYAGIIPFAAIAALMMTDKASPQSLVSAMQAYAAIILTFVGAIHWGRAMESGNSRLMTLSVGPSLVAWSGMLLPPQYGLPLIAGAFVFVLALDLRQYEEHIWFTRLRIQLTGAVSLLLVYGSAVSWENM